MKRTIALGVIVTTLIIPATALAADRDHHEGSTDTSTTAPTTTVDRTYHEALPADRTYHDTDAQPAAAPVAAPIAARPKLAG